MALTRISRALLLSFFMVLAACASRPPEISIPVEPGAFYYDISGNSVQELRASLASERSKSVPGGRFDGYTRWRLRWRYRFDQSEEHCSLSEFSTELIVQLFLPRWSMPLEPDPDLVEKWGQYLIALTGHEGGHVEIAQEAEVAIQSAVWRTPSARSCSELREGIEITIREVIEAYNILSRAYDEASNHGAAQRAQFP